MRYVSTRGGAPAVSLAEALRQSVAPDGGLYVPEEIPRLDAATRRELATRPLAEVGRVVLAPFLREELGEETVDELVADALDFEIPLRELEPGRFLLELFHGPTLAFKDVGARTLARLLARIREGGRPLTVLVATSGDTGGAVADAFHGVDGIRVVVLYPEGKVSPLQERQLATLGGNVRAFAVTGTFDDCQRLVREAFADAEITERAGLTSANSINIGRLLPQVVYHAFALSRLERPVVVVPSGNFGNLTAGLIARRLGWDVARFVAATNVNDVVPEYLRTGDYRPRPSVRTLSNAMDVGAPSNLERIRWLHGDDVESIRAEIGGASATDDETRETIREVEARTGVVLDPHTAVGWRSLGAELERHSGAPGVVLATAHPAKFREEVEATLGREIELPEALERLLDRPFERRTIRPELTAVAEELLETAGG